jgi:hypothetical protein
MKSKIQVGSIRFAILFSLVFLVAFLPSGAGTNEHKLTAQQMQDSINYYRNNTMINYELIKKRIQ